VTWKFTPASTDQRHIAGARQRAAPPPCVSSSCDTSPLVAASSIFEATWLRGPISRCDTLSQTSSKTARNSAVLPIEHQCSPESESPTIANISHGATQQSFDRDRPSQLV